MQGAADKSSRLCRQRSFSTNRPTNRRHPASSLDERQHSRLALKKLDNIKRCDLCRTSCRYTADALSDEISEENTDIVSLAPKTPQGSSFIEALVFLLRLPFLYANTLSSTNDHYLEQLNRTQWWPEEKFPKVSTIAYCLSVAKRTLQDAIKDDRLNHPFRLLVKMAPLGMIFFCASFNLCILQNMKDTLIVSTIGAESLPFLASFGVLPASFLFFGFYHSMLRNLPQQLVFYATVFPLLALYVFFVTVLYPASSWLHLHGFFEATSSIVPLGFHGLLRCIEHWTYSLFFCVAELWGAIVISVLFWSLANDICTVNEAKTIYPLMGISANVALVFAGKLIKRINYFLRDASTLVNFRCLIVIVVLSSLVMMAAKLFIDRTFQEDQVQQSSNGKTQEKKGTFRDGLTVLKDSPKILNLALLVIGYSVSHRFFEVVWKGQLKLIYPTVQEYQNILADVSIWTGTTTITMMLTGKFIFQHLGWGVAAASPPVIMLVTGSVFFLSFLAFSSGASVGIAKLGALAGSVTQVASRASKFSLFDPAKEMVYIEMSKEEKGKGKAAVDLISSQVGKTGASWTSQALLLGFGSISAAMPVFGFLFACVVAVWLFSVRRLHLLLKKTDEDLRRDNAENVLSNPNGFNPQCLDGPLKNISPIGNGIQALSRHQTSIKTTRNGYSPETTDLGMKTR